MFAVLAFASFLLALFKVTVGDIDLVTLGLLFVAAHLAFATYVPTLGRRNT